MTLNSETPSPLSRQEFCLALKAARERKAITLAQIADTTKIPASLFAALERGDLRRWPKGLFRRSFFRDYARTIGLPVTEACEEFVRLFPDEERVERAAEPAKEAEPVRLVLDSAWHGPRALVRSRLLATTIDAGVVILAAAAIAWVAGQDRPTTIAIVALAYFSLATALFGESPAKWVMGHRESISSALETLTLGLAGIAAAGRRAIDAAAHVFGDADAPTTEPLGLSERPAWTTDAHRVGPAPSPRLRVRFKLSQ